MAVMATARVTRTETARVVIIMEARGAILMGITTTASITGRVTRIMARGTGVILAVIMALAGAVQEICAVIYGVQIQYVSVWEVICAVASKSKRGCMGRHTYGTCSNTCNT